MNDEQLHAVCSGNPILGAIGVIVLFSSSGYQNAVNFTSGTIEGSLTGLN